MIGKLRGRSIAELTDRAMHRVRVVRDRLGWLPISRPPDQVGLPWAPTRRDAAQARDLPAAVRAGLVARADAVLAGDFPLLGFGALRYGAPVDWQLDPVSGRRATLEHWSRVPYLNASMVGDHKVTWEVNRHQWSIWLAQAWCLTRDPRYAAGVVSLTSQWICANPPKRGMNWTSALELAFRSMAWTYAIPMLAGAPSIDDAFMQRVASSLLAQIEHVEWNLSTWFSPNTHLTGEALALLVTGVAWPALPGAVRRRDIGWRILCEQALVQHRPDGTYFEQSTFYQSYSVDFYLQAFRWARQAGLEVPEDVWRQVHQAALALRAFARPDGTIPLIGDDDGGCALPLATRPPGDVSDVLSRAAVLFDDPSLAVPGCAGRWALAWLDGGVDLDRLVELEQASGAAAGRESRVMRDGGWIVLCESSPADAAGDHHLVFDAGPHGSLACGHAHADALGLCLTAHGVPLLIDPGTGAYVEPMRSRYRSTRAHATVTVDGLDSSIQASAFRWTSVANTSLVGTAVTPDVSWADAWHDGYERLSDPVRHRRIVGRFRGCYWIVLDSLSCTAEHDIAVTFPWAAETRLAEAPGGRLFSLTRDGVTLHLATDPRLTMHVEARFVCPSYGVEVAAPALVARATIAGNATFCTILGSHVESGPVVLDAIGSRAWRVSHRGGVDMIMAPLGDPLTVDDVTFDGAWLALRTDGKPPAAPSRLVACGAGTLALSDRSIRLGANDTLSLRRDATRWVREGEG